MIRVLIVDDSAVVRRGIQTLLRDEADLQAAGEAANGEDALVLLKGGLPIDVILADYDMPVMDGPELTRQTAIQFPQIPVIILTMHLESTYRDQALAAGAKGYLLKGDDEDELLRCIREVYIKPPKIT